VESTAIADKIVFLPRMKTLTRIVVLLFALSGCSPLGEENEQNMLKEPASSEELGKLLFFDPILSSTNKVSCASCHKPEHAFADNVPFSFGVDSLPGGRNTPSAMNLASRISFFHDGRADSLEQQAAGPIENPVEMNLPLTEAVNKLRAHKQYKNFFQKIYGKQPDKESLLKAIADFERTLETSDTPYDNYVNGSDTTHFSESAKRGRQVFLKKGKCFDCHFGPDFTGDDFRNIGLFDGKTLNDSGRYVISRQQNDLGRFKVPGLRNIAVTAPYMHNGMFKTLAEVIDYYDNPSAFVKNPVNRDTLLNAPLHLSSVEKKDLEEFLRSLTDQQFRQTSL
jgi:cytochrome c peroxidase